MATKAQDYDEDSQPGLQRIVFDSVDSISMELMQRFVIATERSEEPLLLQPNHDKKNTKAVLEETLRRILQSQYDTVYN
ncbi:hypothetical protein Vi05172_g13196 [Venturia inaequalis]|nr:hypothetical protein Vi05172_g13196 [Venturia inaequalis]